VEFYGNGNGETMATASREFTASPDTPQQIGVPAQCSNSFPDAGPSSLDDADTGDGGAAADASPRI
jgi:hypothetical protein